MCLETGSCIHDFEILGIRTYQITTYVPCILQSLQYYVNYSRLHLHSTPGDMIIYF